MPARNETQILLPGMVAQRLGSIWIGSEICLGPVGPSASIGALGMGFSADDGRFFFPCRNLIFPVKVAVIASFYSTTASRGMMFLWPCSPAAAEFGLYAAFGLGLS